MVLLHLEVIIAHGSLESPEFQRQSRDFAAAVKAAGKPVEFTVGEGFNHFEMQETMGNPFGLGGRAALSMMKLKVAAIDSILLMGFSPYSVSLRK